MKRIILFAVIVFGASFLLVGCLQGGSGSTGNGNSGELQELIGVVRPLGVSIYQEGTHRLEKDNTMLAILESRKFNLSQFEGSEVEISGKVRDTIEGSQKIMDVEDLTVLSEADERTKKTRTYVSSYHSYRFEYLPSWPEYEESKKLVSFQGEEVELPFFKLETVDTEESFSNWLNDLSFEGFTFDVETLIRVGDKNATRRIYRDIDDNQIISVSLPEEEIIYHFVFDSRWVDDLQRDKGAYYDLIDSFSFSLLIGDVATEESEDDEEAVVEDEEDEITEDTEEEVSEEETAPEEISSEDVDTALNKGFTTFTSSSLKFSIGIPKSWYYSGFSGVTGAIYRYGFTDYKTYRESGDDINLGNLIAMLDILSGDLDEVKKGTMSKLGSHTVYISESGDNVAIYLKRDDSTSFVMKGAKVLQPILEEMVTSIRVN
jgi:hypothetical protein